MIFYFSGTGNSRYVAEQIGAVTGEQIVSINQKIKTGDTSPISSDTPLVFVGPVYAGRFPRVMESYIRDVNFVGEKRAYFIGTCAATPWATVRYVEKLCEAKGFTLIGFNSILMPQSYVAGGGTQPREVNDRILAEAKPKINHIAANICAEQPLPPEAPGKSIMSTLINPMMYATMISAKAFTVTGNCTGCGKCVARCPLNNITLKDGKPVWGKECTHCMACIAGCPQEAIEYGKKTIGKPRYYLGDK